LVYDINPAVATNTTGTTTAPRQPTGPIYLLLGRPNQVGPNATPLPALASSSMNNLGDPNSLWVTIAPQTGAVGINPNYNPSAGTTLQPNSYAQLIQARSLAAGAFNQGGN
jgi:hypothetical protein